MHIISGKGAGGSKQVFLDYQVSLTELGHNITACVRENSYVQKKLHDLKINSKTMKYSRLFLTKKKKNQLINIHNDIKPHWLIVHNSKDAKLWRALLPHAKILLILHSNDLSGIFYANALIAVNPTLQHEATIQSNIPCMLVANGLMHDYQNITTKKDSSKLVFGYLGKFRRSKGLFLLIQAAAQLPRNDSWCLIMQGEGYQKHLAQLLAHYHGIAQYIQWRPWQSTETFYQDIDILIVPSKKETFGLVILEALMHGKKVLATATPGPSWILKTLDLDNNICPINAHALTTLLHTAIENTQAIATAPAECVWEHYGKPHFKWMLTQAISKLNT